jgi:hypothetical protein
MVPCPCVGTSKIKIIIIVTTVKANKLIRVIGSITVNMNSELESYGNEKEKEKQKSLDHKKTRDGPIELVIRVVAKAL